MSRGYRLLLRLLPRHLRDKHGREMEALFLAELQDARSRGRLAAAGACLRAALDVLAESSRQAARSRPRRAPAKERQVVMTGSDLRHALRLLLRQRTATTLVIAMLALGIAANVAVFSLVNGLFLRPFPFPEPERLVWINEKAPKWNLEVVGVNYPDFHQWRKQQRVFEGIALYDGASFNVSDGRSAERLSGLRVTHDFAALLGVRPSLGRTFTPEEDRPNAERVVMIGHGLWQERFGGAPDVLGRSLRLDGVNHSVVGVLPPEAGFPGGVRLWVPFAGDPGQEFQSYGATAIGRLKPGVSVADADQDLLRTQQPIWEARDKQRVVSPYARPLREVFVSDFRTAARTLSVAVALLLLVACANVASVMLARALARRREMAIRVAVGAGRWQLLRQLTLENLGLALAGGALGILLGRWATSALLASTADRLQWASFALDSRVLAFSVGVTVATVFLFGWAPALFALGGSLREAMHAAAGGATASPRGRRTLFLLVGAEFALASVLLVCGGLLLRAWERVRGVDPGFRADHLLSFSLALPNASYPDDPKRLAFWERLAERAKALPGVVAAGGVSCAPFGNCHWGNFYEAEGRPLAPGAPNPVVLQRYATADYFRALGLRLKSGRFLEARDGRDKAERVVVVNETFLRTFWPGETDAVGKRVRGQSRSGNAPWYTVVGLVGDVKHYGLEREMRPGLYFPLPERPVDNLTLALRTRGEPQDLAAGARALVRELDPDLAVFRIRSMETAVAESLRTRATYSRLLWTFAALALLLALGGAYGVTSYLVSQRVRELGIRIALGARGADVVRSVLLGSLRVVSVGVVLGVAVSLGAARLLATLLFGVPPHDLAVLGGAVGLLLAAAVTANALPAWRASRVDPMATLRAE